MKKSINVYQSSSTTTELLKTDKTEELKSEYLDTLIIHLEDTQAYLDVCNGVSTVFSEAE